MSTHRFAGPNISLSSYTIRVRGKANPNQAVKTDNFAAEKDLEKDLFDVCYDYLNDLKVDFSPRQLKLKLSPDPIEQKLMVVTELYSSGRYLYGLVRTGDYGYESTLINIDTGKVAHQRKSREAELVPFYFLIYLPHNADEGVVILQRFRAVGIREVFLSSFERHFKEMFGIERDSFRMEINPLVEARLINEYMKNSTLKKIRMVQFKMHSDIAEAMNLQDHLEEIGTIEISISARPNGALKGLKDKVTEVFKHRANLEGLIEFPKMAYDTVKCEVDIDGARRTIDLASPFEGAASYDISNQVEIENGHPVFDSINEVAHKYCSRVYGSLKRKGLRPRVQVPLKKAVRSYVEQD